MLVLMVVGLHGAAGPPLGCQLMVWGIYGLFLED